jgi:glycosyltransferase involved in cell wall biosynthesis
MTGAHTKPAVSVIIPTFNRGELLVHALASLREQTVHDWEAVVVDDGSVDNTAELMTDLMAGEPRISLLHRTRAPKGAGTCRNVGLAAARGEYVIFLDSDDVLGSTCLENRIRVMKQHPKAGFAVYPALLFREELDDMMLLWNVNSDEPDLRRFLRGDSVWAMNGPIWRRVFLAGFGGCDEQLTCWQDVDLSIHSLLLRPEYIRCLDSAPDCFVRKHPCESISQNGLKGRNSVASMARVFQKGCRGTRDARRAAGQNGELSQALLATFLHVLELSVKDGLPDLSRSILRTARQNGLITLRRWLLWRYALAARGTRFTGALRRKLTAGLHLPTTIGTERYDPCLTT